MIDYLYDIQDRPNWVFLNSKIVDNGLIPEIVANNQIINATTEPMKLYDKNNTLICEVFIPKVLIDEIEFFNYNLSPKLRINDTNEIFILKEIYI